MPDEAHRLRLPRGGARRALAPHGDPRRQDRQLPPVPADAVERQPARHPTARPGPYEDAVQDTPIFEENGPDNFKGIDIMRTVRSFDPCLPCGVHMYLGDGQDAGAAALAHPVRHRRMSRWRTAGSTRANRRAWRAAGERIEALLDAAARRRRRRRASAPRSWSGRSRTCTAPGWSGSSRSDGTARSTRRSRTRSPPTTGGQPAAGARPAPDDVRDPGRGRPGQRCGPTSARTAATSSCSDGRTTASSGCGCTGSCDGCPSSAVTLELAVEDAIEAAAPEVTAIEVVAAAHGAGRAGRDPGRVAAGPGCDRPAARRAAGRWRGSSAELGLAGSPARSAGSRSAGADLLVCRVGDDVFAYRDRCAAVRRRLAGAALAPAARLPRGRRVLRCPRCRAPLRRRRAGACRRGRRRLHLEPLPLLVRDGVAVRSRVPPTAVASMTVAAR